MTDRLTIDQIKMCVEGCVAQGDTSSALHSIAVELLERRQRDADAATARFEKRDRYDWSDDELRIHADNAEWLTRTIALDLLEHREEGKALMETVLRLCHTFLSVLEHDDLAEARAKFPERFEKTITTVKKLIKWWE